MTTQLDLLTTTERWERLAPLSIERLRLFEPLEGYVLCYSGGKDSDVLLALAIEAGVKFEAVYHLTTIDPPEVVRHVRSHPEVEISKPKLSMIHLIRRKGLPSVRRRWCCQELKEHKYPRRLVLSGVRWAESYKRGQREMIEAAKNCKSQTWLHPIIDWKVDDVWGYLRARGVLTCSLYAEGWKRLGCVCCPLSSQGHLEAVRWPKIAANMKRAWDFYCDANPEKIENPERMWDRFLSGELGRRGRKPQGCPLFADVRDGEES